MDLSNMLMFVPSPSESIFHYSPQTAFFHSKASFSKRKSPTHFPSFHAFSHQNSLKWFKREREIIVKQQMSLVLDSTEDNTLRLSSLQSSPHPMRIMFTVSEENKHLAEWAAVNIIQSGARFMWLPLLKRKRDPFGLSVIDYDLLEEVVLRLVDYQWIIFLNEDHITAFWNVLLRFSENDESLARLQIRASGVKLCTYAETASFLRKTLGVNADITPLESSPMGIAHYFENYLADDAENEDIDEDNDEYEQEHDNTSIAMRVDSGISAVKKEVQYRVFRGRSRSDIGYTLLDEKIGYDDTRVVRDTDDDDGDSLFGLHRGHAEPFFMHPSDGDEEELNRGLQGSIDVDEDDETDLDLDNEQSDLEYDSEDADFDSDDDDGVHQALEGNDKTGERYLDQIGSDTGNAKCISKLHPDDKSAKLLALKDQDEELIEQDVLEDLRTPHEPREYGKVLCLVSRYNESFGVHSAGPEVEDLIDRLEKKKVGLRVSRVYIDAVSAVTDKNDYQFELEAWESKAVDAIVVTSAMEVSALNTLFEREFGSNWMRKAISERKLLVALGKSACVAVQETVKDYSALWVCVGGNRDYIQDLFPELMAVLEKELQMRKNSLNSRLFIK